MQILVDEAEEGQRPDGRLLRAREGRATSQEARGLRGRRRRNRGPRRPLQNWRPQAGLGKMTPAEFREYLLAKPTCLPVLLAAARENGNPLLGILVSR